MAEEERLSHLFSLRSGEAPCLVAGRGRTPGRQGPAAPPRNVLATHNGAGPEPRCLGGLERELGGDGVAHKETARC